MSVNAALSHLEKTFPEHLEDLKKLVRIPSVSFEGFDPKNVRKSAEAVAELLKKRGFEDVKVLEVPGAHPYVFGQWLHAGPKAPTVLLYAHHDVQPPGREEVWKTQPFEPTEMQGPGGLRLYGRGAADDKAGVIVHTASLSAFLADGGKCPVNLKVVIEGEEEAGSDHLPLFLKTYRSLLDADVLVLTDTSNYDCGIPALTVALRGLVGVEVEVRSLSKTVHSGMWGGPLPDPAMALSKMLATLVDAEGKIAIPGLRESVKPVTAAEEAEMKKLPYEESEFRKQSGLVASAKILKEGPNPVAQIWRYPSLTVNAIQASSRAQAGNIICDTAWAKVTIRVVQGMDPEATLAALQKALKSACPWGLEVHFKVESCSGAWAADASGPAFEIARDALTKGYGREPYFIGCGGSIPFVTPFAEALGGAPALLIGVEDPYTNAHGENESLLISDLKKSCASQIHLFAGLAERFKK